jgi:hypothetical protein
MIHNKGLIMNTIFLLTRDEMNELNNFFFTSKNNIIFVSDIINNTESINDELDININDLTNELLEFFTKTKATNGNNKKIRLYTKVFDDIVQTEHITEFSNIIRNNFISFFHEKNLSFKFDNKKSIILLSSLIFKIKNLDIIQKNIFSNDWLFFLREPYQNNGYKHVFLNISSIDLARQNIISSNVNNFKFTEDSSLNFMLKQIKCYFNTSPDFYRFSEIETIYNNIIHTKSLYDSKTSKIIDTDINKGLKMIFVDPIDNFSKKIFIQNFPSFKNRKELDYILDRFRNKTVLSTIMFNFILIETFVKSENLQDNKYFKSLIEEIFLSSYLFPSNFSKHYYFKKDNDTLIDFFPFIENFNNLLNENYFIKQLFLNRSCINSFINTDIDLNTSHSSCDSIHQNIFDYFFVLKNYSTENSINFINNFNFFLMSNFKKYSNEFFSNKIRLMIQDDIFNSLIRSSKILTENDKKIFTKLIPNFTD